MSSGSKQYFPLIDLGRFVAALSVVCFHYFALTSKGLEPGLLKTYLEHGFMGVQLFFMISGFVIFFSLQGSISRYALGRFLRIYPLFWVCCTITYIVTLLLGDSHLPFTTYLYNLLIVNDGKTAYMIDGSYWTLTHEIFFYFYIGIFVYLFGKKHIESFLYIWLGIISSAVLLGLQANIVFKVLLVRSGYYFIFGGLLALLYSTWSVSNNSQKMRRIIGMIIAVSMTFVLSSTLYEQTVPVTNSFGMYDKGTSIMIGLLFVGMVGLVVFSKYVTNKSALKGAVVLGGITYPVYLLHQIIGETVLGRIGIWGHANVLSVSFVICICLISYILYVHDIRVRRYLYTRLSKILKIT